MISPNPMKYREGIDLVKPCDRDKAVKPLRFAQVDRLKKAIRYRPARFGDLRGRKRASPLKIECAKLRFLHSLIFRALNLEWHLGILQNAQLVSRNPFKELRIVEHLNQAVDGRVS